MNFSYRAIGLIRSPFNELKSTPVQSAFSNASGVVELFREYEGGLKDIEGFSHLYLFYHFDRADSRSIAQKPIVDGAEEHGVFATRHFNRPNPIGVSIVRLKGIRGNMLDVEGIDVLDGTPLLDIKPYVRQFDAMDDARNGWVGDGHIGAIKAKSMAPCANNMGP
jgi:tRNA-Thr(GGU) m(6)t(6)A37 methyltransferase TsaA